MPILYTIVLWPTIDKWLLLQRLVEVVRRGVVLLTVIVRSMQAGAAAWTAKGVLVTAGWARAAWGRSISVGAVVLATEVTGVTAPV